MQKAAESYKMRGMRQRLVEVLKKKGIKNVNVLKAIGEVPRHAFLDKAFAEWAYKDQAFPIAADQTISQPYTVAFQTQLLDLSFDDKVLEIGTGSGYQASILSALLKKVYTIERQKILFEKSSSLLKKLGYFNIRTYYGDGYAGLKKHAPFDKILLTAGSTTLPPQLFLQLKIGGKMVIPIGENDTQIMYRITKTGDKTYETEKFGTFKFVPFLEGKAEAKTKKVKKVENPNATRVSL